MNNLGNWFVYSENQSINHNQVVTMGSKIKILGLISTYFKILDIVCDFSILFNLELFLLDYFKQELMFTFHFIFTNFECNLCICLYYRYSQCEAACHFHRVFWLWLRPGHLDVHRVSAILLSSSGQNNCINC